jgi:hypothetical protein
MDQDKGKGSKGDSIIMVFRKKGYYIAAFLMILFVFSILGFLMYHNTSNKQKGTLVQGYYKEVGISRAA